MRCPQPFLPIQPIDWIGLISGYPGNRPPPISCYSGLINATKTDPRDALLKPLQAVSGIVERRHTLPILANVLLEHPDGRLFVTATDLEMQITAHSDLRAARRRRRRRSPRANCRICCARFPTMRALDVDGSANRMTLRAGRSRFNLQALPAADYPRIGVGQDQVQALTLPQRELRGLLKSAEFAMAQQDIRYYLNGMLLVIDKGSLQAVATDGHRLSWASIAIAGDYQRQEVILPRKTVLELSQAARGCRRPRHARHAREPGALPLREHRAREQGRRRQVSRLQPRDSHRPQPSGSRFDAHASCSPRCSGRRSCRTRNSAACGSCSATIS